MHLNCLKISKKSRKDSGDFFNINYFPIDHKILLTLRS